MTQKPLSISTYQGNQILINSDRLVLNSKEDSILLYSNKVIGFSTQENFHFDTSSEPDSKFIVNSPNIYLGLDYNKEYPEQPAVLGDELIAILKQICNQMKGLMRDIEYKISYTVTVPGSPTGPNPLNSSALQGRYQIIQDIMDDLDLILSEKVKLV
tara:strand:- start:12765 stop:13235 length:471 start_codon:yes stop_codon:yes gene_type:complete